MNDEKLLLSMREAAKYIGISYNRIYALAQQKPAKIRTVKVGARRLVPRTECAAYVEREIEAQHGHAA